MKFIILILLVSVAGCSNEKREEVIQREIKLKEARRGHDVTKLAIKSEKTTDDTSAIYYRAEITFKSKDSTIDDSIFMIKGSDGVLLPFATKMP